MADIVQVTKCAAANALGCEKYQEHFILKETPPLPVDHVWLLLGIGDDGLPFRTRQIDGMDQGALSISNLGGCAHATESMLAFFLVSCDEKSAIADKVHQAQEVAYDWMKKSESPDPAAGIRIDIPHVPSNAKYAHSGKTGEPHALYVHFALGSLPHLDGKSQSGAFDRSFAAGGKENGCLRVAGLAKDNNIRPDVPITENSDNPLHWMTQEWCEEQAKAARDYAESLPGDLNETAKHEKVLKDCLENRNIFSEGKPPYRYAVLGFMDNLHCGMLEGEIACKQEDEFCSEHAGADQFHCLLIGCGSYGLKKKGTALKNLHAGETEGIKCRMMGDDVIDL